jgi:hypothetical protein
MAIANLTGVRPGAERVARIAPSFPKSVEDQRTAESASWLSPAGREALRRVETATAKIADDRFTAALNQRGLNEYNDYIADAAA